MAKLTKEELETLQKMVGDFNQMKMQLGDFELQKTALLGYIEQVRAAYQAEEAKLIEKYGQDSVINLDTGEITEKPKEEEKE